MAGNMAVIEHSNNKNPARLHREQWEICFGSLHPLFFILSNLIPFNTNCFEHYVTKLHFTWPQVSCVSGYPPRGIRTVLVSCRDSLGEIQKFAMRFPSIYEAESFINALKEILKGDKDPEPLNTDFGSEILSQSEFMSTIGGMGGYN
ncbi:hypothetical protein GLYMA_08G283200v4 [Glycine max]|uniref:Poor homologous synapsis 1 PH domain-containing protein n=1 Tax=Glycine max TaxID=3847 RepID=A0A0R0ITL0_SOYBN|nr:hypothetical protein GYH30_022676 [Glycine max]KRH45613.1 hypothetical protein GLYMA_08G283200v4 [Glycine max]